MTERKLRPIPLSAAENIARNFGYDQVVIMARRTGYGLDSGEHITTYGINPTHCQAAALMGNHLKTVARWPSPGDAIALDALLTDLEDGNFDYLDYDARRSQVSALHRLLRGGR